MSLDRLALFICAGAAILLSWHNILKLADDWQTLPAYSHGILVPFVVLLLIYLDRENLSRLSDTPSSWGIVWTGTGIVFLLVGTWSGLDFIRQLSILFLVSGVVSGYWGIATLKALRFPILYLLFMIPLPYIVFNAIALPLQHIAAQGASAILTGIQIPVYREGNVINLPHISLGVVQACSGIQSIVSLLAISVLLKKLGHLTGVTGLLFTLSAIPIAVVANMMRIAGAGVLGSLNPDLAEGFFHLFSGWVVFVFALLTLILEIRILRRFVSVPHVA
ncbi:MAG: exosortase [Leptospirales bacterium]